MNIRDPLVHATYFYLREAPGDSLSRRQDRHDQFVADARHMLQTVSGWLAMSPPSLPEIPFWEQEPPRTVYALARTDTLQGHTNASAWLGAYALRNMLLLQVIVLRAGEYPETVWTMLDEALGTARTTPTWLHTTRYWCGVAPRPPEELEQERSQPIKTSFGVLCLGQPAHAHLLVYPDARTEKRAGTFLESLASELDWHVVQAQHRVDAYNRHAATAARNQQHALDQVTHSLQSGATSGQQSRFQPPHAELDLLQITYLNVLDDLATTRAAAQEIRVLMTDYRLMLMQQGLWDAAPSVWEAQVNTLAERCTRIETDVAHIELMLRRMDLIIRVIQTRTGLVQGERFRFLAYLLALLGTMLLAVLIIDPDPLVILLRVLMLALAVGGLWIGWRRWPRARLP